MINRYNDHKRYLIMNIINHLGAVSRTDLAELTGYQLATISTLTKQLIAENILVETGSYSAGHGRKRTLLKLNSEYLCTISVSFSATEVTCITAQFDGTALSRSAAIFSADTTRSGICTCVCSLIQDALLPFLRKHFTIPIEMFHDIALAALVEQNVGAAKGVRDFICIELSNGIGCSICCNGRSVVGVNAYVGELGHIVIDRSAADNSMCYCGKPGCVEHSYSLPILLRKISHALNGRIYTLLRENADPAHLTVTDVCRASEAGDLLCWHCIKQAAEQLGMAIANTVMLLNPEMIVLYGHMLSLGDYFLTELKTAINENVSPKSRVSEDHIIVSPNLLDQLPLRAISEHFSGCLKKEDYNWFYQLTQIPANK